MSFKSHKLISEYLNSVLAKLNQKKECEYRRDRRGDKLEYILFVPHTVEKLRLNKKSRNQLITDKQLLTKGAEIIIKQSVNNFLDRVYLMSDIGPFRESRRSRPEFSMFEPASPAYYEFKYFEESLNRIIREELINRTIFELLDLYGFQCIIPRNEGRLTIAYSYYGYEDYYPFEFIVKDKKQTVGYRYTSLTCTEKELRKLLRDYSVNYINTIDWIYSDVDTDEVRQPVGRKAFRLVCTHISPKAFFTTYFSIEVYNLFVKYVKNAVREANKEIGFTTIPSLSLSYLSKFRDIEADRISELDFTKLVYEEKGSKSIKNLLSAEDYNILEERFINQEFYKSLVGIEKFATSFITSEYMYQILKDGGRFDYTAIVCGYIKSIEQLLYKMLKITLDNKGSRELMIKPSNPGDYKIKDIRTKNPNNRKSWLIPFKNEYEEFFDITLGSMIWFVNDNETGWYLSKNGKNTVRRYLLNYSKEDRNEHFHKDNIHDFNEVKRIRNNTLILMYYLIGGYRLTDNPIEDRKILGVYDDVFDRLYKRLSEELTGGNYFLKFYNEDEIKAIRLFEQDRPVYDDQGTLKESTIRFVKVDRFDVDYEQLIENITKENEIIVSCNNIPEKIWLSIREGKRIPIEW